MDLIIENEKLKKKLRRYENHHTPPSKDERKSRTNFVSKTGLAVDKNMQSQITLLRFDDRLPLKKTILAVERQFTTTLTSKAVYDITKGVAGKATPFYKEIKRR